MSELKSEIELQLSTPINVAVGGNILPCTDIILKAPSNKHRHESAKLKQGFFRALKGMADKGAGEETKESQKSTAITGDELIEIIMMSDVDLGAYQESFRLLMINDICTINGQKLTAPLFDALSDADSERMMGEYIATFLLASHLQKMATK